MQKTIAILGLLASFVAPRAFAAACDAKDLQKAEELLGLIRQAVDKGQSLQPSVWKAEKYVYDVKLCLGAITKKAYCEAVPAIQTKLEETTLVNLDFGKAQAGDYITELKASREVRQTCE